MHMQIWQLFRNKTDYISNYICLLLRFKDQHHGPDPTKIRRLDQHPKSSPYSHTLSLCFTKISNVAWGFPVVRHIWLELSTIRKAREAFVFRAPIIFTGKLLNFEVYKACQWDFQGPPNDGTPFPYYSHTTPIRIPEDMGRDGKGMGIVWEDYHKGVQLLGVPGITLELVFGGLLHAS